MQKLKELQLYGQQAEKRAREAEKREREAVQAREQAQAILAEAEPISLLDKGLPPLADHANGSSSRPSIPSEREHRPVTPVPRPAPKLTIVEQAFAELPNHPPGTKQHGLLSRESTYSTWAKFKTKNVNDCFQYGHETEVANYVQTVLEDLAMAITLRQAYDLSFSAELKTREHRADIWVLMRHGRPVGAIEVKKPGDQALEHPRILGEVYDYLMLLRNFEGLSHVYGILTSYKQWRVCWLEDTDEDATRTTMPEPPNETPESRAEVIERLLPDVPTWPSSEGQRVSMCKEASASSSDVPAPDTLEDRRRLCVSPIQNFDDPTLLSTLAAVLIKMAMSPSNKLTNLLGPDRSFRVFENKNWVWSPLSEVKKLIFGRTPHKNAERFALLLHLGDGMFSRSYLASTISRNATACVLKFPLLRALPDFEAEAKLWNTIWGTEIAKVVRLGGETVLRLPYVKVCCDQGEDRLSVAIVAAVKAAVRTMAEAGYKHNECYWRHVGLSHASDGALKAVLIDLGNVTEVDKSDPGAVTRAQQEMLQQLSLRTERD